MDPRRSDRGERVRRRRRHARRHRRRVLLGRRHDLHLAEVRDRHLQRRARQGAPRQLTGLWPDGRRLLGRLHRRARVRPRGPGRARRLPEVRPAAPDDGVRAPGRLLRRHVGEERLRGEPSRGRRRAGGAGRRPRRRRLRRHQPEPSRHARAARGGLEQRLRGGRPVLVQHVPGPGQPRRRRAPRRSRTRVPATRSSRTPATATRSSRTPATATRSSRTRATRRTTPAPATRSRTRQTSRTASPRPAAKPDTAGRLLAGRP